MRKYDNCSKRADRCGWRGKTAKGAAAVLALLLAVQITGCGGNDSGSGTGDENSAQSGTLGNAEGQDAAAGQDGAGGQGEEKPWDGGGNGTGDSSGGTRDGKLTAADFDGGKEAVYGEEDLDDSWDINSATVIACNGTDAEVSGGGAAAENGVIRITSAGTYILRGAYRGQVQIDAGQEDIVRLVLDGFHVTNGSTSPVYGIQSGKIVLILADGTDNTVEDGAGYVFGAADEDEPDAAIFSKDDLTINGQGNLTVNGNYSNAIRSKDNLAVISGSLNITAVKDGLKGKDSVTVKDGRIQLKTGEDGIKSSNDSDEEKGYVVIDGGEIVIRAGDDGIHAETWLTVNGGNIDIQESYEGLEGLKVDINGGNISVKSTDDGINAAGGSEGQESERAKMQDDPDAYVRIAGGTVTVDAMADGIDSNGSLYVEGGTTYIYGPVSGRDGALDYNGTAVIDGGIFAALGSAGMMQGFSEESGQNVVMVYYGRKQEAGTPVVLTGDGDTELLNITPEKEYECVLISLPELKQGNTYRLSTGSEMQEIAIDGMVTQLGERTGGRGMGREPGMEGKGGQAAGPGEGRGPGAGEGRMPGDGTGMKGRGAGNS